MGKKKTKSISKNDDLKYIRDIIQNEQISIKEIRGLSGINHPLFSFKYLSECSIEDCREPSFFFNFLMRLQKLSALGWEEIRQSPRHAFGMEKIPISKIKKQLPKFITPEVEELCVFRAVGDNRPFIGLQQERFFHILFIEAKFGDIYDHD